MMPSAYKKPTTRKEKLMTNVEPMDQSKADTTYNDPTLTTYFDFKTRTKLYMNDRLIEQLGREMVHWCQNNPEATKLSKFFSFKGISPKNIDLWRKKWPQFAEDLTVAKLSIAERIFDGALTKAYSEKISTFVLPILDEEFKKESERLANIREQVRIAELTRPLTIEMQSYRKELPDGEKE